MVHGLMAIDGHKSAIGVFTGIIQDGHQEHSCCSMIEQEHVSFYQRLVLWRLCQGSRVQGLSEAALGGMHWPSTMPGLRPRLHKKRILRT